MPYTKTSWVNGTTPVNATNMNNLETQYTESSLSFEPDQFTAGFVASGYTAAKDGSIANQLDVAAGTAYLLQADGTTRQRKLNSSTQTTSSINTTYHLYLQPDGTWYWSTSNAPAANSLAICNVATDASGNITTVTDLRPLTAALFPAVATIELTQLEIGPINTTSGNQSLWFGAVDSHSGYAWSVYHMQNGNLRFYEYSHGNIAAELNATGGLAEVGGQATAGNFGVPVIVAQAKRVSVTTNGAITILTYSIPANGQYRLSGSAYVNSSVNTKPTFKYSYTTPAGSNPGYNYFNLVGGTALDGAATTVFTPPAVELQISTRQFHANVGTLDVIYQDPSGTVSDLVSVTLERLA